MKFSNLTGPITQLYNRIRGKSWGELEQIFARGSASVPVSKSLAAEQIREYRSWVYTAVDAINNRFESIQFTIKRDDTGEEIDKEDPSYEIIWQPFWRPNRFMSFRRLKAYMHLNYDLFGRSFGLILRNRIGKPAGLWPLNSYDYVRIHRGDTTTDYLKAFEFRNGKVYPENDIVYFHHLHPRDPLLAMSPIQALAYETDIDLYVAVYERDYFKEGAVPDIVLSTDRNLKPNHAEAIQERWKEKYGGPKKFHSVAITDGGLKPTVLSIPWKDMQIIELGNWSRDKILSAYRVPAGKVGLVKDVNKANSFAIDVTFNSECVRPRLQDYDEEMTRSILYEFDARLYMEHENPVPRDKEFELEEAVRKVAAGIWSRNEARKEEGKPGIGAGGDEIRVNMAEMVVGSAPAYQEPGAIELEGPLELDTQEPEPQPPKPTPGEDNSRSMKSRNFDPNKLFDAETKEGRALIWKQFAKQVEQFEPLWYPMLNRFFTRQRNEVIGRLKDRFSELQKIQSEYLTAKKNLNALWKGILARENKQSLFIVKDLEAIATPNGELDETLMKLLGKWLEKSMPIIRAFEELEEYYKQKANPIISEIIFDMEEERRNLEKEAEPIHKEIFKKSGQEAVAQAYADYIGQPAE